MRNIPRTSEECAVRARDHVRGSNSAPITLLEYGDYESPACSQAHLILKAIQERLRDQVRIVFRHFPLELQHMQAERAAEAGEAAGAQQRFWEMHDLIYSHQGQLSDKHLRYYATVVGLDMEWFNRDMASQAHASRVREDYLSGVRSGVSRTPAFFINGMRHDGELDERSLCAAIEAARHAQTSASNYVPSATAKEQRGVRS
jgi:protein-disulfide isomerase